MTLALLLAIASVAWWIISKQTEAVDAGSEAVTSQFADQNEPAIVKISNDENPAASENCGTILLSELRAFRVVANRLAAVMPPDEIEFLKRQFVDSCLGRFLGQAPTAQSTAAKSSKATPSNPPTKTTRKPRKKTTQ